MKRAALPSPSMHAMSSTNKRGRKRDEFVYMQFSSPFRPEGKKSELVACKHCNKQTVKSVVRCRAHLASCDNFRAAVPQAIALQRVVAQIKVFDWL